MKITKKVLSLLLAIVMVMTSVSICFGTLATPDSSKTYEEDALDYLAEALKSDTIKWVANNYNIGNATTSGDANNTNNVEYVTDIELPTYKQYCEVRDILIYLDKAIKGTKEWGLTANTQDLSSKQCASASGIETELLGALGNIGDAGKEFIAFVLEDSKAMQHGDGDKQKKGLFGNPSATKTPKKHSTTVNVYTTDYKGYLKEVGAYTNVEASVELGFTYSFHLKGDLYFTSKSGLTTYWHFHNAVWPGTYAIDAPSEITDKANKTIKNTVTDYVTSVNNIINEYDFDTLAGLNLSGIEGVVDQLHTLRTNIKSVVNGDNLDNYSTLFPDIDAKIATFEAEAEKAKAIAAYTETVDEITAYQDANPNYGVFNWGGFDEATIKAAYADFMGKYGSIINDKTLYEYFTKQGKISDTYVKNFKDNVVAYDLEDLKLEKIMPLYDKYARSFPMEGGADIPLAEKQTAYSTLSGYINNIRSYSAQVQNAIFPESLNAILDLQEKLECQVAECVLYFAENVGKDYSDVKTEDVIKEIATAKSQLAALNNLKNSINYVDNNSLLTESFANADEFTAYLYSLLGERFKAQVNAADDVYNSIGRPDSNLTIAQYSKLNALIKAIEPDIVTYLDGEGKDALVTQETRDKYAALNAELMPAFNAFEIDRGFNHYDPQDVLIRREDNIEEIFRENKNLDDDLIGEYEVTDENVEAVIELLEAALKDPTVAKLLGDLINKDEDGNPTGEAFSLGGLITGILNDVVFTDEILNTIIKFVYPLVLKEFAKVWADLPPSITITGIDTGIMGIKADVEAGLDLYDAETAVAAVGLFLGPKALASNLSSKFPEYTQVIDKLNEVTIKAAYNKDKDTFRSPWDDDVLFKTVTNDDGTTREVYDLNWGINEAENKRDAFVDAAVAALSGLEPILLALLTNKYCANADESDETPRGNKIGIGGGYADVPILGKLNLSIDPITLVLTFSGNDGWDNALSPIFEAMGLENIPHSEDLQSVRLFLENGFLAMIDQLIAKLDANPIKFILDALPNIAYALEGGLAEPLLHQIKTEINYYADAKYNAGDLAKDTLKYAMGTCVKDGDTVVGWDGIKINIGEMINLKDMGLDISSFTAIWNMLSGVELLAGVTAPDAAYIATLGTLVEKDTNRSTKTYTAGTAGKAYHINANRADVLEYLIQWVLESGLLKGLVEKPSDLINTVFANLENNSGDAIAAIVELLNQETVYDAKQYNWFDGIVNGESVVGNSAYEIYLNPGNDWTKEKAEFLYNNLDSLLTTILTMAGQDLDLGATIADAVDGLLSDKTLTALAGHLAKLDLNAEKTEEKAKALDVNGIIKSYLGFDLAAIAAEYADIAAAVEADENYIHNFGVDTGEKTFAAALTEMLAPFSVVLDFIFEGGNITITIGGETVELLGADGYNNAIIPLLEALGCDAKALKENESALEATLTALVGRIDALTKGDVIKNIIDLLPGVLYFVVSGGLSTTVLNLLQGVLVIVDIVRPVFDIMGFINTLEFGEEGHKKTLADILGGELDLENLNLEFIFDLLPALVPAIAEIDISGLKDVIYDICNNVGAEYDSASTLQTNWKKGAYSEDFDQADLLTVVLSFVLEWATIKDNADKLDEMLGTDGLVANIGKVFEDVEIKYGTPNWMYWFESEEEFNDYVDGNKTLPNTLNALTYPNDWSDESAQYIADNLSDLVDMVIGLMEIDGVKYKSLSALIDAKLTVFNAETINSIVGLIADLLKDVDDNLLAVGYLLDVDIVGLKNYTCTAEVNDVKSFATELANILTTYAGGLVNWLFFGDDFRFAKKSDSTDTIVINGGFGYEKGLALVLEALGCDVVAADEATVYNVIESLAARVEAILDSPVNEVIDLLPNLVYFLNANGASVAVNNILAPVYALLHKLANFGVELDLVELLGFDLKYLSLTDILKLIKDKTGLDLEAAEEILADLCLGKIEKADYTYKMVAQRKDTITVILTTALVLVNDEDFAAKIEELMGTDLISAVKTVFESSPVTYRIVEWYALDENDIYGDNATVGVIKYAITYPNNWTEESAKYLADNLVAIGDMVAGIIDSNYATLGDLLSDKVNIYTPETLAAIKKLLGDLLGGLDADLQDLVNVGLGAADKLLGADIQGLLDYDISGVKDKDTFVAALTGMLMEVEGLVDWLLLGRDYTFFVDGNKDIITINGGHGYAEGVALVLEALGVENLPTVYDVEGEIDTEAVVNSVLAATFDRVDAIFANPVKEVFEILPNIIYFINANGLTVAVENLLGAINSLLIKLKGFGIELDIASLVNFSEIIGVETELALDNLTIEAVIDLVAELTGLNLDKVADVLVGFALGRVGIYESVSNELAYKMYYHDDFAKYDMVTVLATVAIITLTDDANADKVKEMLGEEIYQLILNFINMEEAAVQDFNWIDTDKADTDYVFSAINSSEIYAGYDYGPQYTKEMAQYVADNFGDFVDNVIYLAGVKINGKNVDTLLELINGLLNGSLYNSSNVVDIRDTLAGILANVTKLEVGGKVVGGLIADILKTAGVADINAVADVKVPEFKEDRAKFVESLCDVLEPLYGILKYVLADEDVSFFVNAEKTDAISLKGAEGYAFGIIPLLEVLGCKNILTPAEYYAAVEADGDVLLTSIINPILGRVDEILGSEDPAQEILEMLPNIIYFINSNGVDTVVKNTLNAVFTLFSAIEPIAKIDLYEIIGFDLATIDFDWIFNKLLEIIAGATGYEFDGLDANSLKELTVGKLQSYTSANGKTAYKMVYAGEDAEAGSKTEMVVVIERLIITFIMHKNNRNLLLGLMRDYLGMTADAEKYVAGVLEVIARASVETRLGMDAALTTLYYIYYGIDTGVGNTATGIKDLNKVWTELLKDMRESDDAGKSMAGDLIAGILDLDIFDDIIDPDEGIAPNGIIAFFRKIISFFKSMGEWFKNLFSFGK